MSSGDEAALGIANTLYPPPPDYYKAYTAENIARLAELRGEPSGTNKGKGLSPGNAADGSNGSGSSSVAMGTEEVNELAELEAKLLKPRVDWVTEDGRWMCFGQMYTSEPFIPTAESIGLVNFVDPADPPQTSLPPLLHSFLHTFLLLVDTLTNTARIPGELEEKGWGHEGDQYIQHLTNLAANMMVSANQLRGVQAEATLVLLMERQLAERRKQTEALRTKCSSLASTLKALKKSCREAADGDAEVLPVTEMMIDGAN